MVLWRIFSHQIFCNWQILLSFQFSDFWTANLLSPVTKRRQFVTTNFDDRKLFFHRWSQATKLKKMVTKLINAWWLKQQNLLGSSQGRDIDSRWTGMGRNSHLRLYSHIHSTNHLTCFSNFSALSVDKFCLIV